MAEQPRNWTCRIERDTETIQDIVRSKQDMYIGPQTLIYIEQLLQKLVADVQSATEEDISGKKSLL